MARAALSVLKTNWKYRQTTLDFVKRDFKLRYLGSMLGKYWNVLNPIALIAIYTFIFSVVMKARLGGLASESRFAYTIYLVSGLLPWTAFMESVTRGTRAYLDHAHIIKKISFPMEILETVVAGSATINFFIAYTIFLIISLLVGHSMSIHIILVPFALVLQILFAVGLAMFLGVLNVFFRDIENLVNIVFMVWFWVTPLVYEFTAVPQQFHWIIYLNPFFYFVDIYHHAVFYQTWPEAWKLGAAAGIAIVFFILGSSLLMKFRKDIPDEI